MANMLGQMYERMLKEGSITQDSYDKLLVNLSRFGVQ